MCQVNTNPMISQVGYLQVVGEFSLHTLNEFRLSLEIFLMFLMIKVKLEIL